MDHCSRLASVSPVNTISTFAKLSLVMEYVLTRGKTLSRFPWLLIAGCFVEVFADCSEQPLVLYKHGPWRYVPRLPLGHAAPRLCEGALGGLARQLLTAPIDAPDPVPSRQFSPFTC